MIEVPIQEATEQMVTALAVYHPQMPDQLLLQPYFKLTRSVIDRLDKLGVPSLWIDYPSLDEVEKLVNPRVLRMRAKLAGHVRQAFESIQDKCLANLDYTTYRHTIADLVEELLSHPASVICLGAMSSKGPSVMNHCLRVAYMSVLMGMKLDAYLIKERPRLAPRQAKDVNALGLGAMLHDVGLLELPEAIREQVPYKLDNPDPVWRKHVEPSEAILKTLPPTARAILAQHHQHFDGSGFPQVTNPHNQIVGMAGSQIHVFARIVTVCNVFDRLQYSAHAATLPTVAVLRQMICKPYCDWIDPVIFNALLAIMPAFSPGSRVTLSDGRPGVVVQHQPPEPCRPVVRVTTVDPKVAGEKINLMMRDDLHITHIGRQKIEGFNFKADQPQPV